MRRPTEVTSSPGPPTADTRRGPRSARSSSAFQDGIEVPRTPSRIAKNIRRGELLRRAIGSVKSRGGVESPSRRSPRPSARDAMAEGAVLQEEPSPPLPRARGGEPLARALASRGRTGAGPPRPYRPRAPAPRAGRRSSGRCGFSRRTELESEAARLPRPPARPGRGGFASTAGGSLEPRARSSREPDRAGRRSSGSARASARRRAGPTPRPGAARDARPPPERRPPLPAARKTPTGASSRMASTRISRSDVLELREERQPERSAVEHARPPPGAS